MFNDWVEDLVKEIKDLGPLTQIGCMALLLVFIVGAITAIFTLH